MPDQKILVTGGAGFLGSHVVKRLLLMGYLVVVIDDFSNGKMMHLDEVKDDPSLKIYRGDVTRIEDVKAACEGCSIVIHLAVLGLRQSIKEPERVNNVIINGTINCLTAALGNAVELFINCSSSEVYGTAVEIPMKEQHPLDPGTPYAAAKVAQDMYVSSYGNTYGLPWTTIRPFNMYGPCSHWQGFRGELIPKMIVRAMAGQPLIVFGQGAQTRDFVFVEDVAKAVVSLMDNAPCRGRTLNFCTGRETSIMRIAELICDSFGIDKRYGILRHPPRPGDVARHLGDSSAYKELVGGGSMTCIENGLQQTIEWFRSLPLTSEKMLSQEVERNWV